MPAMLAPASDALSPVRRRVVMRRGELGSRRGVNLTLAQIHAQPDS